MVANFLLVHLAPGDAVDVLAGEAGSATPEFLAHLRHDFGLDQPLYVQLLKYVENIGSLNLGYSFRHGSPVLDLIGARLGPTPAAWHGHDDRILYRFREFCSGLLPSRRRGRTALARQLHPRSSR